MSAAQNILALLERAAHPEFAVRQAAEEQLYFVQNQPGFVLTIMTALENAEAPERRNMAAIYLKNVLQKAPLSKEEKHVVQMRLTQVLRRERHDQIATQLALAFANIVLVDMPTNWRDTLIPIISPLGTYLDDGLERNRLLMALYYSLKVIKQRVKYINDVKVVWEQEEELCGFLLNTVGMLWVSTANVMVDTLTEKLQHQPDMSINFEPWSTTSKWVLKILRVVLVSGLIQMRGNENATTLFYGMLRSMRAYVAVVRLSSTAGSEFASVLLNEIKIIGRTAIGCLEKQAEAFSPLLYDFLDFYTTQLLEIGAGPALQALARQSLSPFLIHIMTFLHKAITNTAYRGDTPDIRENPFLSRAKQGLYMHFTHEKIRLITQLLVTLLFRTSDQDIALWQENPTEFLEEDLREDWENKEQETAQVLFCSMQGEYGSPVTEVVMETVNALMPEDMQFSENPSLFNAMSQEEKANHLKRKDATLLALSLSYPYLRHNVHFTYLWRQWLGLEHNINGHPLIQKRICQVISEWASSIVGEDFVKEIYTLLLSLARGNDIVVAIWALIALKSMLEDFTFDQRLFITFLPAAVTTITTLVSRCEETYTSVEILKIITVLIREMGPQISGDIKIIIDCLSTLWTKRKDQNLTRQAIVNVLAYLMRACPNSDDYHAFMVPMIHYCTNYKEAAYLMKDALKLWQNTLMSCRTVTPHLSSLFPTCLELMKTTPEYVNALSKIVQQYVLKGKGVFAQAFLNDLVSFCESVFELAVSIPQTFHNPSIFGIGILPEGCIISTSLTASYLLQLLPSVAPQRMPSLCEKMLTVILADQYSDKSIAYCCAFFARLLVMNQESFFVWFDLCEKPQNWGTWKAGKKHLLLMFIDAFISKIPKMKRLGMSHLCGVAMAMLLSSNVLDVDHISQIVRQVAQIQQEIKTLNRQLEDLFGKPMPSEEFSDTTAIPSTALVPVTKSELRERQEDELTAMLEQITFVEEGNDPVNNLSPANVAQKAMQEGVQRNGPDFLRTLEQVEGSALQSLQNLTL